MIGIVDYGMGNLFSVSKGLERLGADSFISDDPEELSKATGIILPGVGSFRDAMSLLEKQKLDEFLKKYVAGGGYLLGICLGMQLLFDESEENGPAKGLSLIPGKVVRFTGMDANEMTYKVPHMGWNRLEFKHVSPVIEGLEEEHVYFVHSYYADTDESYITASATYDVEVPAIVGKGNVFGMQFHPEKSGQMGMSLLKNYLTLVEGKGKA
ncbi:MULTISPECIES: imidazole glycerol phosphate synthase subunit HisH [Peribacillus]|uniref:imidazole glycerol phosphate synthase subunit HisH n=1 Tax=Peribacillus TaxID=2675229 RepID=UPI0019127A77|nr:MULTISPECIES: imidazole glycerol phosphate synthase subunit HisH [Peribacillus]MBK5443927.1 imidazole glycerol phosphate synthase subunit HisH [Peribacillus sp. TH24]MBK5461354.1 imidazole glycerol phosphate synthase subunit HisH [Peribacillus sp. TH27]MBK5485326.1 imidazole glycerol phosphate synthase subunit HisH [Peribacillus sp. TH16]MBK5499492.1 imidazole glycerol phosphate synthase subunit HisH [Peribacillus sp. TH14]MCO0599202.1 imidazole glycerol phosphate synthase subunit HisH [Per